MLADISLTQILLRILAMVVLMGLHGFTLAAIALMLGDRGPRYDGRMTLNPFTHLSISGLVSGIATRAGWINPIAIDPAELRFGRAGLVLCVLLSLSLLVLFGVLLMQLRAPVAGLIDPARSNHVVIGMTVVAEAAIWFAALNLLPLPPLTGGHLLAAVAPAAARLLVRHAAALGVALAVAMLVTRGTWLQPLVGLLSPVLG